MNGNSEGNLMSNSQILSLIDTEIARLQSARALLTEAAAAKRGPGRPKLGSNIITASTGAPAAKSAKRKVRVLSPEAKARIADAQRKRWANQKKAAKKAAKTVA